MADYYAERRGVLSSEIVIPRSRLEELERKERAHDAYVRATRKMRVRQDEVLDRVVLHGRSAYTDGWLEAMSEFGEAVVEA